MIKTKNLVILGVALVVLLGVSLMQKSGHKKATNQSSVVELVATGIVPDDLSRITIGFGADSEAVALSNSPVGWLVDTAWGAKANLVRIEALVSALTGLGGEYRSDNADVLPDYGLGEQNAITIRAFDPAGETVIALNVGLKPEGGQGNFVHQPQSNKVYISLKNLLSPLGIYDKPEVPQSRFFLELQALQQDRLEIDRMIVTNNGQQLEFLKIFAQQETPEGAEDAPLTFDRNTWEWRLAGDNSVPLAKTKVDAVLNSMVAIRATDLADPKADLATYGLDATDRRVEMYLQDGRVLKLNFGDDRPALNSAPAGTFMQMEGDSTVWIVTEYAITNIFKGLADLQPDE